MDWSAIKKEYMEGGTSYRKLAKKYNVPFTSLQRTAKREQWVNLRKQIVVETDTKLIDSISDQQSTVSCKVIEVADKLLTKLNNTIDAVDVLDSQSLKHFTSALKDLRDIKGIKSDADMREQEARIDNLRRQAEKGEESKDVTVVISPEAEEYSE